jgi:hypothetical protein
MDADEKQDAVEFGGFSTIAERNVTEIAECLGLACPLPSHACDLCDFRTEEV